MNYAHNGEKIRLRASDWNAVADVVNNPRPTTREIVTRTKSALSIKFVNIGTEPIEQFCPVVLYDPFGDPQADPASEAESDLPADDMAANESAISKPVGIPSIPELFRNGLIFKGEAPGNLSRPELRTTDTRVKHDVYSGIPPFEYIRTYYDILINQEEIYHYNVDDFYFVGISNSVVNPNMVGQAVIAGFTRAWIKPLNWDYNHEFEKNRLVIPESETTYIIKHMARQYRPHYGVRDFTNFLKSYDDGQWHFYDEENYLSEAWTFERFYNYMIPSVCPFELVAVSEDIKKMVGDDELHLATVRFRDRFLIEENLRWEVI